MCSQQPKWNEKQDARPQFEHQIPPKQWTRDEIVDVVWGTVEAVSVPHKTLELKLGRTW